ncbi:MAG: Antitoxin VapB39 [Verrucomicrobiales bacterium]|nr:Antitoxin VapB39 [Verrucomicrobiales bacterium]
MRTTVTLDQDIYEAALSQSKASGKKLGEVLSIMARRGINASTHDASAKSGLPVFRVKKNSEIIPSSRATALLAQEYTPKKPAWSR